MKDEKDYISDAVELINKTAIITRKLDNTVGAIHGIGLTEFLVLRALMNSPKNALRRIDIAEALNKTGSGITRILLPMEKNGIVMKESNNKDARVSVVKPTPAGIEIYNNAAVTMQEKCLQIFGNES